ncbi:ComEC/Rec2 family competence protein [Jannaschia donghaensis]|uniref:ComEC family competence protein n=1 Tax=Jannaschia donghaensis TaxID=420998 RepID=A0A0M6YKX9_9RHOB|nr:ComEC/Rec2 family competence protein [Jannaschia donghaensis]CTQ50580.1 ComEC family competence protein [Jannaschia donghaensis]
MHRTDAALHAPPALWVRAVEACQALRGHRLPWLAVALGTGVGGYFALPVEPGPMVQLAWAWFGLMFGWLAWRLRASVGFVFLMICVAILGGAVAQIRTQIVAGPVLDFRYYGAVEGRIVALDRSSSGAMRVTLDRVRLDRMAPDRTPRRVRLSLQGEVATDAAVPGARIMTTAHLLAPSGPTEPGGFDFQRHAWYLSLGAVGYTRVPVLRAGPDPGGLGPAIAQARGAVASAFRTRMPGQVGEVAAAITTGDRSGLSTDVTTALRASNLAHLLAISGLHMGLLVGFVFWLVRGGLALIPSIALHHPTRIWAALAAFPFATAYLLLSGGSIATQRAFIMAAVMLGAIVLGRRALSMRSIAIAAIIVLLWHPESLMGPGFQMSFAATGALILVFVGLSRLERPNILRGWRGGVVSLLLSSVVAGAATGPIAALHFNRIGHYGVLANMLAVPMMGMAVMPLLFVGLMLIPLGLDAMPLWVAGWGIRWILEVADRVADLPGAVSMVPAPIWQVLPILGAGMAVVAAARSHMARGVGVVLMAVAASLWAQSPRPDVLISDDARLIGLRTDDGRWLSRESGVSFVAGIWLENDGDAATQEQAAARPYPPDLPIRIHHAPTKTALPAAVQDCAGAPGWLVVAVQPEVVPKGCRVIGPATLERTGSIALYFEGEDITMQTATRVQGVRPWSRASRQDQ